MAPLETGDRVIVWDVDMEEYYTGTILNFGTEKSIGFDKSVKITEICGVELDNGKCEWFPVVNLYKPT